MKLPLLAKITSAVFISLLSCSVFAELKLSSPIFEDGGLLPTGSKCTRDGGDGLSPPIAWTGAPIGTKSFALIMHHYPQGRVEGVDNPSHYWLVWNIPADTNALSRGNIESIGTEGSDKDKRYIGYTPPCSPTSSVKHEYVITVYALDSETIGLGNEDNIDVDWVAITGAIDGHVLASSSLVFKN